MNRRSMGHRIVDADGRVVGMMDEPVPSATEVIRETSVAEDRDPGMVDAKGRSVRVGHLARLIGLRVRGDNRESRRGRVARIEYRATGEGGQALKALVEGDGWSLWVGAGELERVTTMRACVGART